MQNAAKASRKGLLSYGSSRNKEKDLPSVLWIQAIKSSPSAVSISHALERGVSEELL